MSPIKLGTLTWGCEVGFAVTDLLGRGLAVIVGLPDGLTDGLTDGLSEALGDALYPEGTFGGSGGS